MSNPNRWVAYESVCKFNMPEMEKDCVLNKIVEVSEKCIKKDTVKCIIWRAKKRMERQKATRLRILHDKGFDILNIGKDIECLEAHGDWVSGQKDDSIVVGTQVSRSMKGISVI